MKFATQVDDGWKGGLKIDQIGGRHLCMAPYSAKNIKDLFKQVDFNRCYRLPSPCKQSLSGWGALPIQTADKVYLSQLAGSWTPDRAPLYSGGGLRMPPFSQELTIGDRQTFINR